MIIQSHLDKDAYKATMQQAVFELFPTAIVEYSFKCRTEGIDFRAYEAEIIKEVMKLCTLRYTKEELEYLGDLGIFKKPILEFWRLFQYNYEFIRIHASDNGELHINIKGPWVYTIDFEIPLLSIISEVYSKDMTMDYEGANKRTMDKIELIKEFYEKTGIEFKFIEFGGRRRHSLDAQINAIELFIEHAYAPKHGYGMAGTSNLMLAKKYNIPAKGTMAHEWLQAHQALYRVEESQVMALMNWAQVYKGDLGMALSDVIGLDAFLYDFGPYLAKLYDGTRQDSGDPVQYGERLIRHYADMNINPMTKTVMFSDGLDMTKALELTKHFNGRINTIAGIGTHITNDFPDFKALQIVLKMITCNGRPVAKLSNTPGKTMSPDKAYVQYLTDVFNKRIQNNA